MNAEATGGARSTPPLVGALLVALLPRRLVAALVLATLLVVQADLSSARAEPSPDLQQSSGESRTLSIQQVGGRDRIETAVRVSRRAFPEGASAAVLARADVYADALAGSPLAVSLGGPLLLTRSERLDGRVAEELRRLRVRRVVLLGGPSALAAAVHEEVAKLDVSVQRLAGSDRFDTAAQVAKGLQGTKHAFVVEGIHADPMRGWPDAVAVSGLAAHRQSPILLVYQDRVPEATQKALAGLDSVTIVGGTAAISDAVENHITRVGPTVDRIGGRNRYETSVRIAEKHRREVAVPMAVWLASGQVFADALTAGPASAASNGLLLLVDGFAPSASGALLRWLSEYSKDVNTAVFVGSDQAIMIHVRTQLTRVLQGHSAGASLRSNDAGTGLHYTPAETAIWRQRAVKGPYRSAGDVAANSPGDWNRIRQNAVEFLSDPQQARWQGPTNNNPGGCVLVDAAYPSSNPPRSATIRLRDAAFYYLITEDLAYQEAVKKELLWFSRQQGIDFSRRARWCTGVLWDLPPSWDTAIWLSKLLYAYDYLGAESFTAAERQQLNKWFYDAASFWQADLNTTLDRRFADRWSGDHTIVDNYVGSCNSTTVGYQGSKTICALPKFYNNRRAHVARFVTSAGIKLELEGYDAPSGGMSLTNLKRTGKLFAEEWLMFSVYPEGFFGEFERWTKALPILGWVYTAGVMSPIATIADELARSGDTSLLESRTRDGAHGTASDGGRDWLTGKVRSGVGQEKSLEFALKTYGKYVDGSYVRYGTDDEGRTSHDHRIRSFHAPSNYYAISDVGLAMVNVYYRDSYIKSMYTRTGAGMPGYPTNPADGGLHGWMAHGGTYPGVLLMFGQMEGKVWPY